MRNNLCIRNCNRCKMSIKGACNGCSLCDISFCNCKESSRKRCMVICPKKLGSFSETEEMQNKNGQVSLMPNKKYNFPKYIPIMPDRIKTQFDFTSVKNYIGVHGEFLLTANGEEISPIYRLRGFKDALGIDSDIKGIAEFYIKDRALEGFWDNRQAIYTQIKNQKFDAVITPNFSLYEDAPRIEHLYNIQRVKTVYNEMINAGISAVLDVVWATEEDLMYWIDEINKSDIKTIAFSFMNVGTKLKASNSWRHYLLGYKILIKSIRPDVDILIAGLSSIQKIVEIVNVSEGRNISILNQAAWVNSRKGFSIKHKAQLERSITKDEIFMMNMKYLSSLYQELE